MNIRENTFAHACIEQNTLAELESALQEEPDQGDMEAWQLNEQEWRDEIGKAITYLRESVNDEG